MIKGKDYILSGMTFRLRKRGSGKKELFRLLKECLRFESRVKEEEFRCEVFKECINNYHEDFLDNGQESDGRFKVANSNHYIKGELKTFAIPCNKWVSISLQDPFGCRTVEDIITKGARYICSKYVYPSSLEGKCSFDGCEMRERLDYHHVSPSFKEIIADIISKHSVRLGEKLKGIRFQQKMNIEVLKKDTEFLISLRDAHINNEWMWLCPHHHKHIL